MKQIDNNDDLDRGYVYKVVVSLQQSESCGNCSPELRKAFEGISIDASKMIQLFALPDIHGLACWAKAVRVEDHELPLTFPKDFEDRCDVDDFAFHQVAYQLVGDDAE